MELIFALFFFVFGTIIGSFLNVLIYRIPRGISFAKGRSFCPKCKNQISWYDNVPLLSFLILGGKCRRCGKKISLKYPLIEALTGAGFVLSYLSFLSDLSNLLFFLVLFSGLLVIFFIDIEHQIIPDEILIFLFLIFSIYRVFLIVNPSAGSGQVFKLYIVNSLVVPLLSGFVFSLFLFLIFLLTKGKGMGFGDVKFAMLIGFVLGYPKTIVAFYLAFLTGAFIGVILILVKKAKFGRKIAFGPYLVVATLISYLWGEKILNFFVTVLF